MTIQEIFKDFQVARPDTETGADFIIHKSMSVVVRNDDRITVNGNLIFVKALLERQADLLVFMDNLSGFAYILDFPKVKQHLAKWNKKGFSLKEAQRNGLLITTKRI